MAKQKIKTVEDIENLAQEIMGEYNQIMDTVIDTIDSDYILGKFKNSKNISDELESLLNDATDKTPKKKGFLAAIFTGQTHEIELTAGLRTKADYIIGQYRDCYEALKTTVEMQIGKGRIMEAFIVKFQKRYKELQDLLPTLSNESFEEHMIISGIESFMRNMEKMSIAMKQKMTIMKGSITTAMGLKSEMAAGMHHFEAMLKDILTGLTLEEVVRGAANIINTFRNVSEKFNQKNADNMIKMAVDVQEIQHKGIVTIESLNMMGKTIDGGIKTFKSLQDKTNKEKKETAAKLVQLNEGTEKLSQTFLPHKPN